ncbi:MAG TPA: thiosulfate oxidation carrier complex protein SoxZ [Gammaproteobacteria bacterium]|nr:thiosulfate oxidation carrier complex protein SoxZ [Gammaproteobacteria bacterium]
MTANSIKIKAEISGDKTLVKAIILHSMEASVSNSKNGNIIPARFIKEAKCKHNGELIFTANWSTSVANNPYLSFRFAGGKKNDTITISWLDSQGNTDTHSVKIR